MRLNFLFLAFICCVFAIKSQEISNIRAEILGDEVYIYYDIEAEKNSNQVYNISIFCNLNEFSVPLKYVRGSVGKGVKLGKDKKITWEFRKEGLDPSAGLDFKISTKLASENTLAKSEEILIEKEYKAGKEVKIQLNNKEIIVEPLFELYQNDIFITNLKFKKNKKNIYFVEIPEESRKGDNYKIKAGSAKYTELFLFSNIFVIK